MKRYLEIIIHLLFWVLTGYFFLKYSFIRPTIGMKLEIISTFMIAFSVYLNYYIFYPYFFKKNKKYLYIFLSLFSVVVISLIEGIITSPIIRSTFTLPEPIVKDYIQSVYFFVGLRNFGFLLFFVILKFYLEAVKVNRLEKEKFSIENTYLRSRIAPHFLYNVLNSIYADALVKDENLPNNIFQLSKLLHYYVDESHHNTVPIKKEMQFYESYIEFENKRYDQKIDVQFSCSEVPSDMQIAPLLFEPLLSNAFKYVHKDGTGEIAIHITFPSKGTIKFDCKNNKWNEHSQHLDTTSIGLNNLKSRLSLLYPNKHQLLINETEDYYHAVLTIDLH